MKKWMSLFYFQRLTYRNKILKVISPVLFVGALGFFLLFIIVLTIDTTSLSWWRLTNIGLEYLIQNYNDSIKVGTAFLAILAIYLTIRRMNQTETQIITMTDNYSFNNYYRNQDEFIKHLKDVALLHEIAARNETTIQGLLTNYHRIYYGKEPIKFTGKPLDQILERAKTFTLMLQKSALSETYTGETILKLDNIPIENIMEITSEFRFHISDINNYYSRKLEENPNYAIRFEVMKDNQQKHLSNIGGIYLTQKIISQVLSFTSETLIKYGSQTFLTNAEWYFEELDMKEIYQAK